MTENEAREQAMNYVFLYMNIGDIEDACAKRGLRVKSKQRHEKEKALIDAITKELTTAES